MNTSHQDKCNLQAAAFTGGDLTKGTRQSNAKLVTAGVWFSADLIASSVLQPQPQHQTDALKDPQKTYKVKL